MLKDQLALALTRAGSFNSFFTGDYNRLSFLHV